VPDGVDVVFTVKIVLHVGACGLKRKWALGKGWGLYLVGTRAVDFLWEPGQLISCGNQGS
jgi:hypothetical protein